MVSSRVACVGALIRDDRNRVYVHRRWLSRRLLPGTRDVVGGHTEIAGEWERLGVSKWMAYSRADGGLVGRGGLSRALVEGQERLEVGWVVRSELWGRGYATEIGRAGLAFAFDDLGARQVVAFTDARNARSRAVMGKLGMRYTRDITYRGKPDVLCELDRG